MAKLPDALSRRHLLEGDLEPAKALALADTYLEQGRTLEAVAFLAKAEANDRLRELRTGAVSDGDVFLLREVSLALAEEIDAETWTAVADAAAASGRDAYAAEARRQALAQGGI